MVSLSTWSRISINLSIREVELQPYYIAALRKISMLLNSLALALDEVVLLLDSSKAKKNCYNLGNEHSEGYRRSRNNPYTQ